MTKKPLIVASISVLSIALAVFVLLPFADYLLAKPLEGNFFVGKCGCSHDMFILVEGGDAYENNPGHKVKTWLAHVTKTGNQLTFYKTDPATPIIELKAERGGYQIRFPQSKDKSWEPVKRITNPLRTVLPYYLPE